MKMTCKNCLLAALGLLLPALAPAQKPADEVHLRSGARHQGIVIEQKPGESIRLLRLPQQDTLAFAMEDIERITRILPAEGSPVAQPPAVSAPAGRMFNDNPWVVSLHASTGGGTYSVTGFGAAVQKRLSDERALLGIGLQFLADQNNYGVNTLPLTLNGAYELTRSKRGRLGSMAFLDLGYSVNFGGNYFDETTLAFVDYGNGLHLNTGIRFRINVLRNTGIWLDAGYLFHNSQLRNADTREKWGVKSWSVFLAKAAVFF